MDQNERGLPEHVRDTYGPVKLDDTYLYDEQGNVDSITDATAGNLGNRTMHYDNLDRLVQVDAPQSFGTASYGYDKLDNLTRVTIGGSAARDHWYCYSENRGQSTFSDSEQGLTSDNSRGAAPLTACGRPMRR